MRKALIVEDHPIVSDSLNHLISGADFDLECFVVSTSQNALAWLNGNKPEIILLDINLPDGSGIDLCRLVKQRFPDLKILAITSIEQRHVVDQMMEAGANGFILKRSDTDEIPDAIRQVIARNGFIS